MSEKPEPRTTQIASNSPSGVGEFRSRVWSHYRAHGRHDLPWRLTRDPYAILVSEVMLQQTQVSRVIPMYDAFLAEFPTLCDLARAPLEAVLRRWQGLGYNRRAVWLKRAAEAVVEKHAGCVPRDARDLEALPGIGPTTTAGVLVFAFSVPAPYLETNVRAVYLHEFFADQDSVRDCDVRPLVVATMDVQNPREWFWALLDYGSWLKRSHPNPSRRSAHHARQSPFEGSNRQKRARLLRAVLDVPGRSADELASDLGWDSKSETLGLLGQLEEEGFLSREGESWQVA